MTIQKVKAPNITTKQYKKTLKALNLSYEDAAKLIDRQVSTMVRYSYDGASYAEGVPLSTVGKLLVAYKTKHPEQTKFPGVPRCVKKFAAEQVSKPTAPVQTDLFKPTTQKAVATKIVQTVTVTPYELMSKKHLTFDLLPQATVLKLKVK
jgi:hypothetical protein